MSKRNQLTANSKMPTRPKEDSNHLSTIESNETPNYPISIILYTVLAL